MAWKIMVCVVRLVQVPVAFILVLAAAPFCIGFGLVLLVFFLIVDTIRFIAAAINNDKELASQTLPMLFTYHIPQWLGVLGRVLLTPVRYAVWAFEPFKKTEAPQTEVPQSWE